MITTEKILENITAIREKQGFNQTEFAKKISMTQGGYNLIEKGERGLELSRLLQIAMVLGVNPVDFFIYPKQFTDVADEDVKAILTVELKKEKKDQILRLVFGDNNIEILNK